MMTLFIKLLLIKEEGENPSLSLIRLVYDIAHFYCHIPISCDYQVTIEANAMSIKCPHQLMINGNFVNSSWGRTYDTINPANEKVLYNYYWFMPCDYYHVTINF